MATPPASPSAPRRVSVAPPWAESTVRWLRTNQPLLLSGLSHWAFDAQLIRALKKCKFRYLEMVDQRKFSETSWETHLVHLATLDGEAKWGKPQHDQLVKFLKDGGYKKEVAVHEKVMVGGVDSDGLPVLLEEIALEVEDLDEAIKADPGVMRPQLSPKHDLEEAVAEVMRTSDSRFGVW